MIEANKCEWKILRLEEASDMYEALAIERRWQLEFRDHQGFLNRFVNGAGFFYDGSGSNNPNAGKWILLDPVGNIHVQPKHMTASQFAASLGHSHQMLMKYKSSMLLPCAGSFAGWKIISYKQGGVEKIVGPFSEHVRKKRHAKPKKVAPHPKRGSVEFKQSRKELNLKRNAVQAMHTRESWDKISKAKRANSMMCTGPFTVVHADGTSTEVDDLLTFSDNNCYPRNTIRHLLKTGLIAKQGPCKGMSIHKN